MDNAEQGGVLGDLTNRFQRQPAKPRCVHPTAAEGSMRVSALAS